MSSSKASITNRPKSSQVTESSALLRQLPVVLGDLIAETRGHFVGSGQRERILIRLGAFAQVEFERLQLFERGLLQLLKPFRISVRAFVPELLQLRDHVVQVFRAHAGILQVAAQRLRVALPLAELTRELASIERLETGRRRV